MTDSGTPARIATLPIDKHGYPVPWFVAWIDGKPDFRIIGTGKINDALRFNLCWICGTHLGSYKTFLIGPMCAVNRVSAEPPSHHICAEYSARVCPFLTTPNMTRRGTGIPEDAGAPGMMITRNPGVALVWQTRRYTTFRLHAGGTGLLFEIGDPLSVSWWAHGRPATRAEVLESIETGLPILTSAAEREGAAAVAELTRRHSAALELVPA